MRVECFCSLCEFDVGCMVVGQREFSFIRVTSVSVDVRRV